MAATTSLSRALILSLKPLPYLSPSPPSPLSLATSLSRDFISLKSSQRPLRCFFSAFPGGVDGVGGVGGGGGGVSETRRSGFTRDFAVICRMLMKIEPLDTSVVSQGVSESAKDSMKQTISAMLGLLPSDQFDVSVRVGKASLGRILASSIITGYTLWNTEYRISLMRNFKLTFDRDEPWSLSEANGDSKSSSGVSVGLDDALHFDDRVQGLEESNSDILKGLNPKALNYIRQLEAELSRTKEELNAQKQEFKQMNLNRPNENNLLEYLRSLKTEMVSELSRPSSTEVKEVIHQLAQNIRQSFFKDVASEVMEDRANENMEAHRNEDNKDCETISTSRDHLAKLLFWCMLLGHHLRGLENSLHLSCVVGLL
ncbi:hypothetical protein Droror1_Dr00024335 [Drosera rotundifolia]